MPKIGCLLEILKIAFLLFYYSAGKKYTTTVLHFDKETRTQSPEIFHSSHKPKHETRLGLQSQTPASHLSLSKSFAWFPKKFCQKSFLFL